MRWKDDTALSTNKPQKLDLYVKLCVRTVLSFQSVHLSLSRLITEEEDLTGADSVEEQEMDTTSTGRQVYDCVICNQTTHSTAEKLMGLVVLVQVCMTQCSHLHYVPQVDISYSKSIITAMAAEA